MRFYLLLLFLLLLSGWRWDTHANLAEAGYHSLPLEVQKDLNLSLIREGAIAPDKDFHDQFYHRYPYSVELAGKWLDDARLQFALKEYDQAGYSYGVATHYLTDSFAAPHSVSGEPYALHSLFERQVDSYFPKAECTTGSLNLEDDLWDAAKKGHEDWFIWLDNRDRNIPRKEVENAVVLVYKAAHATFGTSCLQRTDVEDVKPRFTKTSWALFVSALLTLGMIFFLLITA